jgi:hypothetical protein
METPSHPKTSDSTEMFHEQSRKSNELFEILSFDSSPLWRPGILPALGFLLWRARSVARLKP